MNRLQSIRDKIKQFQPFQPARRGNPDIKVACIMDPFSYECFKYECDLVQLRVESWNNTLVDVKPDFLLVESAWKGVDGKWYEELVQTQKDPKSIIRQMITFCKENKIATVFWNKEDPPNYTYFIHTAKLFDYIFTTDEGCVKRYKNDVKHDRIYTLPFAAQPAIHNPIHSSYRNKDNAAFTGSWRGDRYPDRQADMHIVLQPTMEFGLTIFDRNYNSNKSDYTFPKEYQPFVAGSLNYSEMVMAYKLFKVFLNVNSVFDSSTMFSRRVFEILASGSNIVSTYSKGIELMFKGIVPITQSGEETREYVCRLVHDQEYSERLSLLGVREVYSKHLYRHRFDFIREKIGMKHQVDQQEGVSVIVYANTRHCMDRLFSQYKNQSWENKELVIMVNNDSDLQYGKDKVKAKRVANVTVYLLNKRGVSSGRSENLAVDMAKYNYVTFFDGRHFYAPHFITDLMHAFEYSNADIVGKSSYFAYSSRKDKVKLQFPNQDHQFVDSLNHTAMIVKKEVFSRVKFTARDRGPGIKFCENCRNKEMKFYSADKYNYLQNASMSSSDDHRRIVTV